MGKYLIYPEVIEGMDRIKREMTELKTEHGAGGIAKTILW
jgi:hypothetical protein